MMQRAARGIDRKLGYGRLLRKEVVQKIFPDHWSFLFGEIALYSFVILLLTGLFLFLFFRPSTDGVTYGGSYTPLVGVPMSAAYRSMLHLSFDVPLGLLARQIHHWAANLFVAAIVVHVTRLFLTGAFRNPRQDNWRAGVTLLILAIVNGFTGYSLGDDLLSGTGLRIGYAVVLSVPVIGSWLAFIIFGGPPPNPALVPRLYGYHIFLVPLLIALVLAAHLGILWRQKHTNYPGPGRSNTRIVGSRLWPVYAAKSMALFFFVSAILIGLGAFAQINPIWLYGPYAPAAVSAGSQPDWYLGWLEGSLRLFPGWSGYTFGYLWPQPFFAAVLLGLLTFGVLYAWPYLDRKITGDGALHHVLRLPREHPFMSMLGMAVLALYVDFLLGGSDDVIASILGTRVVLLREIFQGLVLGLPLGAAAATGLFLWIRRKTRGPAGTG